MKDLFHLKKLRDKAVSVGTVFGFWRRLAVQVYYEETKEFSKIITLVRG